MTDGDPSAPRPHDQESRQHKRVGILISGSGSNMAALIAASRSPDYPADIVIVISNRTDAGGLVKAASFGIETVVVDHKLYAGREAFDRAVDAQLRAAGVDLVCMAGFMRIVSPWFAETWADRMLNIHPALLPSYTGLHTHARARRDGVKIHGCTVHFVRTELDVGPIVAQAAVAVRDDDTEASLAARVLAAEHRIYPAALAMVASGRARLIRREDGSEVVHTSGVETTPAPLMVPTP
jgi:phosphoribosylglycinamide formyltransferase-1